MALTKVSGGILDPGINVAGIVTATGFDGPFTGGTGRNITAGIITATELDLNGNGNISGNLIVEGNLTANGDFTTLNTTLREVEILRVDADTTAIAGIITQRGTGDIFSAYDTSNEVFKIVDGGDVGIARSIFHLGDTNTLIGFPANDTISFETAGSERFSIESDGNVKFSGELSGNNAANILNHSGGFNFYASSNSSNNNNIIFCSSNTAASERLRITSGGEVGINTSVVPYGNFAVDHGQYGLTRISEYSHILVQNKNASTTEFWNFAPRDDGSVSIGRGVPASGTGIITDKKLTITSGGQLVIGHDTSHFIDGSSNGHFRLQVSGTNYATSGITQQRFENNNSGATLALAHSRNGTQGSHTILAVNDEYGKIRFYGSDGTDFEGYGAAIVAKVETGIAANRTPGRLEFHTTASGNQDATERLRITHTGNIGVGGSTGTDFSLLDGMVINTDNGDAGLMVNSSSSSHNAYISFSYGSGSSTSHADQFSAYVGRVGNDNLIFGTQNNLRWKIDSSGHLVPHTAGAVNVGSATTEIGDVYIADSKKAYFGSDQDFQISHNGSHAIVKETTGRLYVLGDDIWFKNQADNESLARFMDGGEVFLYNNDNLRLTTTTTGITVGGEVAASQDYPNFRPTLDLNFAAEKKLDPRITYSRTGAASFVNEFGKVVLVGDNAPKFDHDPVTKESKGLLIEESRTNLVTYSHEFDQTNWSNVRTTDSKTVATNDPQGLQTAFKLVANTDNNTHRLDKINLSMATSTAHTFSVWAKAAEYTGVSLTIADSSNNAHGVYFDLSAGTFTIGSNAHTGRMEAYPNGWYRCFATFTTPSSITFQQVLIGVLQNGTTHTYAGNGSSGIYIWGAQLEVGAFATSYIPTDSATVTRGADQTYIDGDDFLDFYNQTEGTVISSHSILPNIPSNHNLYTYQIAPDSGTAYAPLRILDKNSSIANSIAVASVYNSSYSFLTTDTGNPVTVAGRKYVIAASIKKDDYDAVFDGGDLLSDSSGDLYTADHISFGYYKPSPQAYLNGHIQRLIYYPTKLTNNQLKTITS